MGNTNLTFDDAQDMFRNIPTQNTATAYLNEALIYWEDSMIGNDTMAQAIDDIAQWLESNPASLTAKMIETLEEIRSLIESTYCTPDAMDDPVWLATQRIATIAR